MQEINTVKELKTAIRQLESDQKKKEEQLKAQLSQTKESLKPANIVRGAVESLFRSPWVMMIGLETIKSFGHRLIDKIWPPAKTDGPTSS